MLEFICYAKCTTCQKAKKWLDDNGVEYKLRDIKEENPGEKVSQDDVDFECKHWLIENTTCISMDDGSVIINTEF